MSSILVSSTQACSDEYFNHTPTGQWGCKLCAGRTFKDKNRHARLKTHIDRVRVELGRVNAFRSTPAPPGLGARSLRTESPALDPMLDPMLPVDGDVPIEDGTVSTEHDSHRHDDVDMSHVFDHESDELESLYDSSQRIDLDFSESEKSSIELDHFLDDSSDNDHGDIEAGSTAEGERVGMIDSRLPWYPLRKKEHAAALLILGTGRNLMSTSEYNRLRRILKMVINFHLPEIGHVKEIRRELKDRLGLRVLEKTSPLGNPCFTLSITDIITQELSNPEVASHLEFFPEIDKGVTVDRYSQSKKWREELPPRLRVPMVDVDGEHFYIYEPAQLQNSRVVVPTFFYKNERGVVQAKCLEIDSIGPHDYLMAAESKFEWPGFLDVDVQTFATSYPRIVLRNGQKWCESRARLLQSTAYGSKIIELPNAWRVKANGLAIRSVPIALYSDDTSGNVSKKWNKHMSYYFTLAGLKPKLTNQEYHIHPLCTSNIASALEQGDQIVDEINHASTTGFRAYDCNTREDVLVIPFILCHMGDSPMHSEISNTTNPSGTLSPCRICNLTVESRAEKQTETYIQQFVGINENWLPATLPFRNWKRTQQQTKELWLLTRNPKSIKQFDVLSKEYGICDSLNLKFAKQVQEIYRANKSKTKELQTTPQEIVALCESLEQQFGDHMFNPFLRLEGFDGHLDTPVESLHVVLLGVTKYLYRETISNLSPAELFDLQGRWQAFQIDGLNVAPIQPRNMVQYANSLLGKDFRVVLQAAPFVFFEFLPDDYRHCWIALVHLASLIFQTAIFNKQTYIQDLKIVIHRFLHALVGINAQWTNKPKFHILTHLAVSVERFGPPGLFATEKMEAQNGVTRAASVHSNRHAPGKDIGNRFNDERLLRMLISGGSFFDTKLQMRAVASKLFRKLFNEREIRHGLGLHLPLDHGKTVKVVSVPKANSATLGSDRVPQELLTQWPSSQWKKCAHVVLSDGRKVTSGSFVLVNFQPRQNSPINVGRVAALWSQVGSDVVVLHLKKCKMLAGLHPFYGMRELKETSLEAWVLTEKVTCVLNVQHNCHEAHCAVTLTKTCRIERTVAQKKTAEVTHNVSCSFILNAGAHYSSEYHRWITEHNWSPVTPEEWEQSITEGLSVWFTKCPPKTLHIDADEIASPEAEDEFGDCLGN
ncbi:hypothetical protein DFH28DRAFT_1191574 [Melampsora americana]|nr:hypothetical protein DFH28DRAFT_1191574 [Melampsora americana]